MTIESLESLDELPGLVESGGGVLSLPMVYLRDAYGAGRLGVHVRSNISEALRGLGLAHMPAELPDSQWQEVRIYRVGSKAGKLIEAVMEIGERGDGVIREATSAQPTEVLERIRELVCD